MNITRIFGVFILLHRGYLCVYFENGEVKYDKELGIVSRASRCRRSEQYRGQIGYVPLLGYITKH